MFNELSYWIVHEVYTLTTLLRGPSKLLALLSHFQFMEHCAWKCASENVFGVCRKTNLRRNGHGNSHLSCGILKVREACTAVPCLMLLFQKQQSLTKNVSIGSRIVILCFEALGTKSRQTQLSCQG